MRSRPVFVAVPLSLILAGQAHAPVVYFARMADGVKIGTTVNLSLRMQDLYVPLRNVLAVVPGGKETEDAYHDLFEEYRIRDPGRKELFRMSGRLEQFLHSQTKGVWDEPAEGLPVLLRGKDMPPTDLVSLREYADLRKASWAALHARRHRWRARGWPAAVGYDQAHKGAELYRIEDLDAFCEMGVLE